MNRPMTYREAVAFLYGLQTFGMKFGLTGIRRLLRELGNPHEQFPAIHIAGSNGKGSVASMLAAILTAAGYRTGLYTSPHLMRVNERIRIDGCPIPSGALTRLVQRAAPTVRVRHATFFETMTAVAFRYFADANVDIAVIETGLGGRLDATNVLRPLVSVITSIDLEHTQILGSTLSRIAREKGGIIKPGIPCVTGSLAAGPARTIRRIARSLEAPLIEVANPRWNIRESSLTGFRGDVRIGRAVWSDLCVSLSGPHQSSNAAIALQTVQVLRAAGDVKIPDRAVRTGLAGVEKLSGLHGRLERVRRRPFIVADVAHNPAAMRALASAAETFGLRPAFVMMGVMKDKAYVPMIEVLAPVTGKAFVVTARTSRSRDAGDLRRVFARLQVPVESFATVREGLRAVLREVPRGRCVLITGSHFVVGEALAELTRKIYLTINQ